MQKVSVIILNYNGGTNTLESLDSLVKITISDFNLLVIIVDNNSTDGSLKKIQDFVDKNSNPKIQFKIIENKENLGFAGGNNQGIKFGLSEGSEYFVVLNNDTRVDRDLIKYFLDAVKENDKTGIVVPKIFFEKGFEYYRDKYKSDQRGKVIWYAGGIIDWNSVTGKHIGVDEIDNGQYDMKKETEFATGCCFLVSKKVLEKVGFFDEKYFLYYEDADLSERVKKEGYKIIYYPKAFIWHKNAGSAGGSGSALQDYFITRNRLLFGLKYGKFKAKAFLVKESLKLLLKGRKWQKRGVKDFYFRKLGKGTYFKG